MSTANKVSRLHRLFSATSQASIPAVSLAKTITYLMGPQPKAPGETDTPLSASVRADHLVTVVSALTMGSSPNEPGKQLNRGRSAPAQRKQVRVQSSQCNSRDPG